MCICLYVVYINVYVRVLTRICSFLHLYIHTYIFIIALYSYSYTIHIYTVDREALGALTQAIKEFAGGIVIISHNSEFTSAICTETWVVKDGTCYTEGEAKEGKTCRL